MQLMVHRILTFKTKCNNNCKHAQGGTPMIRIAVLGCGRIGAMHAANIAEAALKSIAEGRAVRVSEVD